jgi:hypothetical protein
MLGCLFYRRQRDGKVNGIPASPRGIIKAPAERPVVNGSIEPQ